MKKLNNFFIVISVLFIFVLFQSGNALGMVVGSSIRDQIPSASQEAIREVSDVVRKSHTRNTILSAVVIFAWIVFASYLLYRKKSDYVTGKESDELN